MLVEVDSRFFTKHIYKHEFSPLLVGLGGFNCARESSTVPGRVRKGEETLHR